MSQPKQKLYRVKFIDRDSKDPKDPLEVIVSSVGASEYFGLIALEGFIFKDQKKYVILPGEDAIRKRFGKTDRLHIPYHNIIYVEEYFDEPTDIKNLPFIKEVPTGQEKE